MNHGFAVEREGMPDHVRETHVSLFDGSIRDRADRPPGVQRAISPEGEPSAAGQLLSLNKFVGAMRDRHGAIGSCDASG